MGTYDVTSSTVTHQGTLSRVRVDQVVMSDGAVAEREIVEHPSAVAVVPVQPDGRVVLIRHYRHAVSETIVEIPAGKLDVHGESPDAAARRELLEEVGLEAAALEQLACFYNSSGWTDEMTTVYLARDVRPGSPPSDFVADGEEADIEILRLPLADAVARVVSGSINDAKTVIGLLLADRQMANDGGAATP
ncbi:MAG: NUDIX domain-containing protein [Nitriliruptorales bacterium]|nr:NUDIX domain-containing protein [Nitriliruptorales bacterium]